MSTPRVHLEYTSSTRLTQVSHKSHTRLTHVSHTSHTRLTHVSHLYHQSHMTFPHFSPYATTHMPKPICQNTYSSHITEIQCSSPPSHTPRRRLSSFVHNGLFERLWYMSSSSGDSGAAASLSSEVSSFISVLSAQLASPCLLYTSPSPRD